MCSMTVSTAMPVVRAKATVISTNIFVMLIRDIVIEATMLNIRMLFLRKNTYSVYGFHAGELTRFVCRALVVSGPVTQKPRPRNISA
jgi:hypothetical protein